MGAESCVVRGVFPNSAVCLCASVSDGANVRYRSEAPVIVRFG